MTFFVARRREEVKVSAIPTWKDQLDRLEHDPVLLGAGELWGVCSDCGSSSVLFRVEGVL